MRNETLITQSPFQYTYRQIAAGLASATKIDFMIGSVRTTSPVLSTRNGRAYLYVLRNVNQSSGNMGKSNKSTLTAIEASAFQQTTSLPTSIAASSQYLGSLALPTGNFDSSGYVHSNYQIPVLANGEDLWFVVSTFSP